MTRGGCTSTSFDVSNIRYNQVCGKIIAYQDGSPDAFFKWRPRTIDSYHVDGISLTHGAGPRRHIWTFAASFHEDDFYPHDTCPCTNAHQSSRATASPGFVGNDYFCGTGSTLLSQPVFYSDDPLWDGAGCGPQNSCCSLNNPPWFYKQLPVTTHDSIEMRICANQETDNEDTLFEIIELYVK